MSQYTTAPIGHSDITVTGDQGDTVRLPAVDSLIALEQVGLTYPGPPPVEALRPCDLTIDSGEYVAIVGPSGSGKSTLLNVLGLLDKPTTGRYLLDGHDTSLMPEGKRTALRATTIGFVFQSFHLMPHRTAEENVALSLIYQGVSAKDRRERAQKMLEHVGLDHRIGAVPTTLSGGERQRVAIARALAAQPSLLLCDEPTGNLDSRTADSVMDTLDELNRDGQTILIITHDQQVADHAARTVTIRDGLLSEEPRDHR